MTADLRLAETPSYQPGQKVLLSNRDIRMCLPCKKLSPEFIGPFTIIRQIKMYLLQLPAHYRIHPAFHVSLLKPHHSSVTLFPQSLAKQRNPRPPLLSILEDGATYQVKKILDSRRREGILEYLIDWGEYEPDE